MEGNIQLDLLKKLVSAFGPSGYEDEVAEIIIEEIGNFVDEIKIDRLGNVIALKKGKNQDGSIMTVAHMDQIGIVITSIDENGYLRFTGVGHLNPYAAISQCIVFKNRIIGYIVKEEISEIGNLKLSNLYIDIGTSSKEEVVQKINIGDFGVLFSNFIINGDRISSGALDNRIGCYVLTQTIRNIRKPEVDVYFVFTVQEETCMSGATTSAYEIEPDSAIVIDVTPSGDTPKGVTSSVKMGEGCTIKVMENGLICNPKIKQYLTDLAEKNNIKYQYEVLEGGSTDGSKIHISKTGVLTGVISIPSRYIHSSHEMVDVKDVNSAINLLTKALEEYHFVIN